MLKNKWFLLYVVVTALIGFARYGVLGGLSLPLFLPGSFANEATGGHHNNPLILGGSLVFWIALHLWFKHRSAAPAAVVAPHEITLTRQRTIETFEE